MVRTRVGFTGGTKIQPTYRSLGDHTETVELEYDTEKTSYSDLLDIFWNNHDPTIMCSRQYMSVIFYHDEQQKKLAEESLKSAQSENKSSITTQILPAETFYNAEDYHQKYMLRKHDWLIKVLKLDNESLITSSLAARINGYVGGYGDEDSFSEERTALGLNDEVYDYVLEEVRAIQR